MNKSSNTKAKKAVLGFSAAGMLMLSLVGANVSSASAQSLRSEAPTRAEVPVERPTFNFEQIKLSTGDGGRGGTTEAKPEGDCSGVAECNDFIADCIAAGGEFEEEHSNPQGQPNLGHCN